MNTATVEGEAQSGIAADADAALFERLYPALRRFAAVTAGRDDDPDDLVQEAVARTLRRCPLSSLDNPGAYLRQAIVHLASNRRRSLARGRLAMLHLGEPEDGTRPEYASDLADLLRLQPADRALLFLIEVEGHHYADAAAVLGISEEAARTRARRARRQLRLQIIEET
jgi:RNA polymerase sigma-70 factor (ECF subfamily)